MKILFPYNNWGGGFLNSIASAFETEGHEVFIANKFVPNDFVRLADKITKNISINYKIKQYRKKGLNEALISLVRRIKPDVFFNISGSGFYPETIQKINRELKVRTICVVADNPCDPSPIRDKYFATSLRFYDILINPEPLWDKILRNLAPDSKVIHYFGGYDSEKFYYDEGMVITQEERTMLSHDIVFTGGSYGHSPEGAYRAGILGQLAEMNFNVAIWGDSGWLYWSKYFPTIRNAYKGRRLDYSSFRKMLQLSKIYINMPSPQILSSFQPRVFEIAACKGFQIIDHSDYLTNFYALDKLPTFKSFNQLVDLLLKYINDEQDRAKISEYMYITTANNYTVNAQFKKNILSKLLI